jgi:hypothetical protein
VAPVPAASAKKPVKNAKKKDDVLTDDMWAETED